MTTRTRLKKRKARVTKPHILKARVDDKTKAQVDRRCEVFRVSASELFRQGIRLAVTLPREQVLP